MHRDRMSWFVLGRSSASSHKSKRTGQSYPTVGPRSVSRFLRSANRRQRSVRLFCYSEGA